MRPVTGDDTLFMTKRTTEFLLKERKLLHTIRATKHYPSGREEGLPDTSVFENLVQVTYNPRYFALLHEGSGRSWHISHYHLVDFTFPDKRVFLQEIGMAVRAVPEGLHYALLHPDWVQQEYRGSYPFVRERLEEDFADRKPECIGYFRGVWLRLKDGEGQTVWDTEWPSREIFEETERMYPRAEFVHMCE